jgi:hypothetical protein
MIIKADMLEGTTPVGVLTIHCVDREDAFRRMMDLAEGHYGAGKPIRGKASVHPLGANHPAEWRLRRGPEPIN